MALLDVKNLSVTFRMYEAGLRQRDLQVITNLDVRLDAGEIVAVAGPSGSGKSLLAHAIMGLLPGNAAVSGDILYKGQPLTPGRLAGLRGRELALIPQSVTYLDPLMRVAGQVGSSLRQKEVFKRLDLSEKVEKLYPFQLSGGMTRRVLFSTAVLSDATLIIADEPTPGMHGEQAIEALTILKELAENGKSILLITHDIDLAFTFAHRVAVFYAGTTVEEAPAADFRAGPAALRHPYSKALWQALPQHGFTPLPGAQPYAGALPGGCLFAPRCSQKTPACEENLPPAQSIRGGFVRCIHAT